MSNTTFYLKYRGQTIDQIDIAEIRESLSKIVHSGKIPHAFLFSGPKGIGKTSAARILAKAINCEKPVKKEGCGKCDQCESIARGVNIDVIELDAASHRGIDDARVLRDAVRLSPAKAKNKVYIIDEAHMLTAEASNALLKTLEEPPEHVYFILATTNPEKLIPTIRSRVTNILFRKATPEEVVRALRRVAKGEKIKVEDEELGLFAEKGGGSFRDSVKLFEQYVAEGKSFKEENVKAFLFKNKIFDLEAFFALLLAKKSGEIISEIEKVIADGGSIEELNRDLLDRLRIALLTLAGVEDKPLTGFSKNDLLILINLFQKAYLDLKVTPVEQLPLEVAVIIWCGNSDEVNETQEKEEEEPKKVEEVVVIKKMEEVVIPDIQTEGVKTNLDEKVKTALKEVSDDVWKSILSAVRPINTSIEALLRAARPIGYDGKSLTLGVFYKFHKERLEDIRNRKILEDVVETVMGNKIRVVCTLTEQPPKKEVVEESKAVLTEGEDKDIIKIAEEIFGN
jgi:DNA polymerase III subunit gamma/tau